MKAEPLEIINMTGQTMEFFVATDERMNGDLIYEKFLVKPKIPVSLPRKVAEAIMKISKNILISSEVNEELNKRRESKKKREENDSKLINNSPINPEKAIRVTKKHA